MVFPLTFPKVRIDVIAFLGDWGCAARLGCAAKTLTLYLSPKSVIFPILYLAGTVAVKIIYEGLIAVLHCGIAFQLIQYLEH